MRKRQRKKNAKKAWRTERVIVAWVDVVAEVLKGN